MKVAYIPRRRKHRAMDCACTKCKTKDASGASMKGELEGADEEEYADLVERIQRALGIVQTTDHYRAWMTGDEDEGHEFHGNQYTGGLGAKPTEAKVTGVKSGVHELLSSGHGFTMEELQKATGATTIKQISDALAMLKNPKYAGAKGVLKIEKKGSEFFVTKGGEPVAPPAPVEQPKPIEQPKPEEPALAQAKMAPGTATKEQGDAYYKAKLNSALDDLAFTVMELEKQGKLTDEGMAFALADFKKEKAEGMADWATMVKGGTHTPKPGHEVIFEADKQLAKDLLSGTPQDKAFADWKTNTAKEKVGTWPPEAVAAKQAALANAQKAQMEAAGITAKQEAAKQEAEYVDANKAHAPLFEPVHNYVPDDHVHVSAADFLDGKFKSQQSKLRAVLMEGHTDKVGNKIGIQKALEARLKDSKAFQALSAAFKKKGGLYGDSLEAQLISAWASTSADTHPISIANQIAVREAFGMDADDVSVGAASSHLKSNDDEVHKQAASQLGFVIHPGEAGKAQMATFKAALRDFALAQYHNTQEHLAAKGIDHVYVARGMKLSGETVKGQAKLDTLKLQPASSFAPDLPTAHKFTGSSGGSLYFVKVPRSQVLSSYVTGFGCTGEHEVVVLAHPSTTAVKIKASDGSSMESANQFIKDNLVAQTPELKAEYEKNKAKKATAAAKKEAKTAGWYKPPDKPKSAKVGGWAKKAHTAAKSNNLAALQEIAAQVEAQNPMAWQKDVQSNPTGTVGYVKKLVTEMQAHQAKAAEAKGSEWMGEFGGKPDDDDDPEPEWEPYMSEPTPALPPHLQAMAQKMEAAHPSHTSSEVHVPGYTPPPAFQHAAKLAPGHIVSHPHYDPVQYTKWLAEGKTDQWVGKKLAMIKFQAKQKAMAEHVLGA